MWLEPTFVCSDSSAKTVVSCSLILRLILFERSEVIWIVDSPEGKGIVHESPRPVTESGVSGLMIALPLPFLIRIMFNSDSLLISLICSSSVPIIIESSINILMVLINVPSENNSTEVGPNGIVIPDFTEKITLSAKSGI